VLSFVDTVVVKDGHTKLAETLRNAVMKRTYNAADRRRQLEIPQGYYFHP
jgi:hypothetical protein